jgi:hypothetical protein
MGWDEPARTAERGGHLLSGTAPVTRASLPIQRRLPGLQVS